MESFGVNFPDIAALELVRKRLWSGRAVVFVGAGYSKHALTSRPGLRTAPLWSELCEALRAELYPNADPRAPSDCLRLAEEYAHTLSRDALHARVAELVADDDRTPSALHRDLLRLPWKDVLTTNYDTLLEKAIVECGRRYAPIYTPNDLPRRSAPRIVKLHGSLPSHTPFILTEEDFRTYPQRFAPFVHLTQTLLMENALLMIGFSGDDPNFLQWSGWVRDQLGGNAPPIYLAGWLNLSGPKRTLLTRRGIAPIDLAPLYSSEDWPDPTRRHTLAAQWLLASLANGEPADPMDWPQHRTKPAAKVEHGPSPLPPWGPLQEEGPSKASVAGQATPTIPEKAKALISKWIASRRRYPGWVVAPRRVRNTVEYRDGGDEDVEKLLTSGEVQAPDDLALLQQWFWRKRILLSPVLTEEAVLAELALNRYDVGHGTHIAPSEGSLGEAVSAHGPTTASWDWKALTEAWVEVALCVLRMYREDGVTESFARLSERLKTVVGERVEWVAEYWYEQVSNALARADREGAKSALALWPSSIDEHPFGEVRRAALLAEVGETQHAFDVASMALGVILRAQAFSESPSLALRSQEGYTRRLLDVLALSRNLRRGAGVEKQPQGWHRAFETEGCDPFEVLRDLEAKLQKPLQSAGPQRSGGFLPGSYSTSHSILSQHDVIGGYEFVRAYEETAHPYDVAGVAGVEALFAAATRLWFISPAYAFSIYIRTPDQKAVEARFTRRRISGIEVKTAREVAFDLIKAIDQHLADGGSRAQSVENSDQQRVLLTLISRFARVVPDEDRVQIVLKAIEWQAKEAFRDFHGGQSLLRLFRVLLGDLPERHRRSLLGPLFAMSLDDASPALRVGFEWPEPAQFLGEIVLSPADLDGYPHLVPQLLSLFQRASEDSIQEDPLGQRAFTRLLYLYQHGALTVDQGVAFAHELWRSRRDNGVPSKMPSPVWQLAYVPPPPGEDVRESVLREVLLTHDLAPAGGGKSVGSGAPPGALNLYNSTRHPFHPPTSQGVALVDWTPQEAMEWLSRLEAWWITESRWMQQAVEREEGKGASFMQASEMYRDHIDWIPLLLNRVVVYRIELEADAERVVNLLEAMEQEGFEVARTYVGLAHFESISGRTANALRKALAGGEPALIEQAAWGVRDWAVRHRDGAVSAPPPDLVQELVNMTSMRRPPGLQGVMKALAGVIRELPGILTDDQQERLGHALVYLARETAPPSAEEAWTLAELPDSVEHPAGVRAAAAVLARALFDVEKQRGDPPSPATELWAELASRDSLPEVRAAWE